MIERLSGSDAMLWHLESPDTPMHTLKTVVVDWTARGRPLTPTDIAEDINGIIALIPRLRQKVQAAPGFPARPFWVDDRTFDVASHVDEVDADPPGDRAALDRVHTRLASAHLDLARPLWAITLVNGLSGNRQGIVTRIHHAVVDGGGALNGMLLATDPSRGPKHTLPEPPRDEFVDGPELRRRVLRDAPSLVTDLPELLGGTWRARQQRRAHRATHPELPRFSGGRTNFANRHRDEPRVCASIDLPLDTVRRVARSASVTVNGVYHALIAAAFRDQLLARGERTDRIGVSFAIATDDGDPRRTFGNHVAPTYARLATDEADPVRRLERTAARCSGAVELQRSGDLRTVEWWATYLCRLAPWAMRQVQPRLPVVPSHILTANVRGPDHRRWAGDLEITDWISFAVVAAPGNINVTAHSYDDRLAVGLLVGHGVLAEPISFLERMALELDDLDRRLAPRGEASSVRGETTGA